MAGRLIERRRDADDFAHVVAGARRLFFVPANARRRAFEARPKPEQPDDVVKPADQQQHHTNRPDHGRGAGRDR
ncbi:hypothetical protein [Streptomyces sp. NPDC093598]|uniref:hypothetical protein n=1 Tax=Streptomyces sp. NPDC093598 TaxID=3366046 RepID=UPI00381053D3